MKNKKYWIAWAQRAGVRAARTVSQIAIAEIGVGTAMGGIDWIYILSTSAIAGVLSLLSSVRGLPEVMIEENEEY